MLSTSPIPGIESTARALLLALLFLALAPLAYAQPLQQVHEKFRPLLANGKKDTAFVRHLLDYSYELMEFDNDSSYTLVLQATALSDQLNYTFGKGRSALLRAMVYSDKGLYDSAQSYFQKAIPYFKELNNERELAKVYNNMANLYNFQGLLNEAIEGYLKAATLLEKTGGGKIMSPVYINIATIFQKLGQYPKSMAYLDKAEKIAREHQDTMRIALALIARAIDLSRLGKESESFHATMEAMRLSDRIDHRVGRYTTRLNMADHYSDNKQYDSALYYLQIAESLAKKNVDPYYLSGIYLGFGKVYQALEQQAKAEEALLKAVEVARPIHNKLNLQHAYSMLTKVYMAMGNRSKGMDAFGRYQLYSDSLRNEEVSNQVNTLETRFRTLQKDAALNEKELAIARKDLELRRKNNWIALTVGGIILLIALGLITTWNYRRKQQLQQQKLLTLQREHELALMKAMMEGEERERSRIARNLHDGVGSILSAARLNMDSLGQQVGQLPTIPAYRESLTLLKDATSEIRETAHNLMPVVLREQGLREAVRTFCNKFSNSHQLAVEYQTYGEPMRLHHHFELMVYRTIQELINNVIKHASATHVLVQLSFHDGLVGITVEDNGKGFDPTALGQSGGLGAQNLQERLAAFQGKVDIDSSTHGTSIHIEFKPDPVLYVA